MFDNLKNSIFAVESLEQELVYWNRNNTEYLENYKRVLEDNPDDEYSKEQFALYTARVELYNEIMKVAQKFVKSQI